ncbi:hypothetical protein ABMA59_18005 [Mesorhizobium sp. CN2-181]
MTFYVDFVTGARCRLNGLCPSRFDAFFVAILAARSTCGFASPDTVPRPPSDEQYAGSRHQLARRIIKCFTSRMKSLAIIWALMLVCAGLFIVCDSFSAHWGKTGSTKSLMAFVALSPLSYFVFAFINRSIDLAVAGALVNTLIVVGAVLVGVVVFEEELSRLQYLGIGLALASVTLLNMG